MKAPPTKIPLVSIDEVRETDEDCIYSSEYKSSQQTGRNSYGDASPSLNVSQKKSSNKINSAESLSPPLENLVSSLHLEEVKIEGIRELTDILIFGRPKADAEKLETPVPLSPPLNQSLSNRTLSPSLFNEGQSRPFKKLKTSNKENSTAKREGLSREFVDRRSRNTKSNQKNCPFVKNGRWYKSGVTPNHRPSTEPISRPSNIFKEKFLNGQHLFKLADQNAEITKQTENMQLQDVEDISSANPFKKSMKKYLSSKELNINVLTDYLTKNPKTIEPMNRSNTGFQLNSMRSKQKSQGYFEISKANDANLPAKELKLGKPSTEDQSNNKNQKWLSPNVLQDSESKANPLRQEELPKPYMSTSSSYFNQVIQNLRQVPSLVGRSDSVKARPCL